MFASPDEVTHLVRAHGVVRGDLTSPYWTGGMPVDAQDCFAFNPLQTADCQDLEWETNVRVPASSADEYPPLFHFVVGLPSLLDLGSIGIYLTRVWLAVLCSALLAFAGGMTWISRPRSWTLAGILMGCTPMLVFVSGTVNPSGLTTAIAAVIWASGIAIVAPSPNTGTPSIAYPALLVAATLFPLLRRDSVFFELVIIGVLATLTCSSQWRRLASNTWLRATAATTAISSVLVVLIWSRTATETFTSNSTIGDSNSRFGAVGDLLAYLYGFIGKFGWNDTQMTSETYSVAIIVLGAALTMALAAGPSRWSRGVLSCLLAVLLVPVAVGMVKYPYFQGRYLLPLTVGLFLLVGIGLAESKLPKRFSCRMVWMLMLLWAIVHFLAFAQNLRRYAVGAQGTWNLLDDTAWSPPILGNAGALGLAAACIAAGILAMSRLSSLSTHDRADLGVDPAIAAFVVGTDVTGQIRPDVPAPAAGRRLCAHDDRESL